MLRLFRLRKCLDLRTVRKTKYSIKRLEMTPLKSGLQVEFSRNYARRSPLAPMKCSECFFSPHCCNGHTHTTNRTFVILSSVLTWLGLSKEEKPESELILTMKRGILAMQREEYKKSEQILHIALKLAQEQQNGDAITYIYDLLANVAFEAGEHAKAEKLFVIVMQRLLSTGTAENDNKIIHISLKVATICKERGDTGKAEDGYKFCINHLEKKVEQADDDDTHLLWAMTVDHYARLLLDEGKYKEAITYFEKAYNASVRVSGLIHEQNVILLNDIGSVYSLQNEYDTAIEYLKKAVSIGKQIPVMEDLASIYVNLGTVYLKKMMLEEAQEACQEGWKKAKSVQNKEALDEANICLDELKLKLH